MGGRSARASENHLERLTGRLKAQHPQAGVRQVRGWPRASRRSGGSELCTYRGQQHPFCRHRRHVCELNQIQSESVQGGDLRGTVSPSKRAMFEGSLKRGARGPNACLGDRAGRQSARGAQAVPSPPPSPTPLQSRRSLRAGEG